MVISHSYVSLPEGSQTIQTMMLEPAQETYVKTCDTTGTVFGCITCHFDLIDLPECCSSMGVNRGNTGKKKKKPLAFSAWLDHFIISLGFFESLTFQSDLLHRWHATLDLRSCLCCLRPNYLSSTSNLTRCTFKLHWAMPILVFASGYTVHDDITSCWNGFGFISYQPSSTPHRGRPAGVFSFHQMAIENDIIAIILSSAVVHYSYHNLSQFITCCHHPWGCTAPPIRSSKHRP